MSDLPHIVVLGSLNIDLVSYVSHHPAPGETMTANSFAVSPGGKGANQAIACAKLSRPRHTAAAGAGATARVSMVGAVGADSYGAILRDNLAAHGVGVGGVSARAGLKTGVALIVVDEPTGQNRIILSPEANHALRPEAFGSLAAGLADAAAAPEGKEGGDVARLPDMLILQLEIPLDTVLQALRAAKAEGVAVLLNPAPAVALPDEAFAGLAHLVLNETEAAILSGADEAELETEAGLQRIAGLFIERGVGTVIITLGGRGVYYRTKAGAQGLVEAEKAKVVDTTAAGDTFVGQYALEVVSDGEFDIAAAVRKANRAAAKTVERLGAQESIPWRDELE